MIPRHRCSVLAVLALVIVAAAAPAGARTIGEIVDDTRIATEVKAKLTADTLSNLAKIDVKSESGIVTLSGTVDSLDRAARAAQIAATVSGVKGLVNNLQVRGAGTSSAPATAGSSPTSGAATAGSSATGTSTTVDATGTVAQIDRAQGTITLQDGRVLKTTRDTVVWQPTTLEKIEPGTRILLRDAGPVAFQQGATPGAPDWHMGTVSRVDAAANQLVLTDGTIVRVGPSTSVNRAGAQVALGDVRPGSEVAVRVAPTSTVSHSADGSALPRQTASGRTIDAAEIRLLWIPPR